MWGVQERGPFWAWPGLFLVSGSGGGCSVGVAAGESWPACGASCEGRAVMWRRAWSLVLVACVVLVALSAGVRVEEDQPGWDCHMMGNYRCG